VASTIIGLALALMTGSFSSALLAARVARNTTTAEAIIQTEFDQVRAAPYNDADAAYSECFTSQGGQVRIAYQGACTDADLYRVDVSPSPYQPNVQRWTVLVQTWPQPRPIVPSVDVLKDKS
jgi:hypothetical protein